MEQTVFVVEDDKIYRAMIVELLKQMGFYRIVASTNGYFALEKMKVLKPDLIISDWNMPVMNGLELYKAAKKEGYLDKTPFLMLTVESDKEKIVEALGVGIKDYILKPVNAKQFQTKVKSLLHI